MKKELDKIMVITGTSRGIGRFLVEYYTKKGFLVAGCSRSPKCHRLENYYHYQCDVSDERQVKDLVLDIDKRFGRLDVLINNAGIASMNHMLLTPLETVQKILSVNFIGTFLFCREATKIMMKNKWGRIVNFSSIAVPLALEGEAIYASSKSAVETLTKVLAKELAKLNITVNVVGPAPIQTDLIRNVPSNKIEKLIDLLSLKRLGKFDDVTNVIDFFINKKSDAITGQVIYLGGI